MTGRGPRPGAPPGPGELAGVLAAGRRRRWSCCARPSRWRGRVDGRHPGPGRGVRRRRGRGPARRRERRVARLDRVAWGRRCSCTPCWRRPWTATRRCVTLETRGLRRRARARCCPGSCWSSRPVVSSTSSSARRRWWSRSAGSRSSSRPWRAVGIPAAIVLVTAISAAVWARSERSRDVDRERILWLLLGAGGRGGGRRAPRLRVRAAARGGRRGRRAGARPAVRPGRAR